MIALRGERDLGSGSLNGSRRAGDDVLVARNGDTVLVINMGEDEAQLSGLGSVLIASGDVVEANGTVSVPANTAVWLG